MVLSLLAGSSIAAEVTVYGSLDTGFTYSRLKESHSSATHSFTMGSGLAGPSCWGIQGKEELSQGYTVSFSLESEFKVDDGSLTGNRLFQREAILVLNGPFGEFAFGRLGTLTSSAGAHEVFLKNSDINAGGWATKLGAIGGLNFFYDIIRADNTISYVSPDFSGLKFHAQYSFKADSVDGLGNEGRNSAKRYAGAGLSYKNGPLTAVAVFDATLNRADDPVSRRDGRKINLGGNYDFGSAKVYFAYQYGRHESWAGVSGPDYGTQLNGHVIHVGTSITLSGQSWLALGAYYTTVKSDSDSSKTGKTTNFTAHYTYGFSKRTYGFVGVGYGTIKDKMSSQSKKYHLLDAAVGVHHIF